MKLSAPSHCQQILFVIIMGWLLLSAQSQAQQATLKQRDRPPVSGNVLAVSSAGIQFQTQAGTITYPLISVESVQMAAPAEVNAAEAAFVKKDYPKTLELAKSVSDKFQGLPTEWAQRMTALVGDLYVVMNDLDKAEAAYDVSQREWAAGGRRSRAGRRRQRGIRAGEEAARSDHRTGAQR
ncbi:MAG: hypothetical protein ABI680_13815 [Chthoniobacteraceae bacterium]